MFFGIFNSVGRNFKKSKIKNSKKKIKKRNSFFLTFENLLLTEIYKCMLRNKLSESLRYLSQKT